MQTCKKNKETGINKRKWSKNFHKEILNLTSNQIQTEKIMFFFLSNKLNKIRKLDRNK